jgi:hypothetical protein
MSELTQARALLGDCVTAPAWAVADHELTDADISTVVRLVP